uniref:Uncharacterized protein n=1 Tax=Knipowitschia caucasica TaxID=637954 RepID=A0AAV2MJR2_KNICA
MGTTFQTHPVVRRYPPIRITPADFFLIPTRPGTTAGAGPPPHTAPQPTHPHRRRERTPTPLPSTRRPSPSSPALPPPTRQASPINNPPLPKPNTPPQRLYIGPRVISPHRRFSPPTPYLLPAPVFSTQSIHPAPLSSPPPSLHSILNQTPNHHHKYSLGQRPPHTDRRLPRHPLPTPTENTPLSIHPNTTDSTAPSFHLATFPIIPVSSVPPPNDRTATAAEDQLSPNVGTTNRKPRMFPNPAQPPDSPPPRTNHMQARVTPHSTPTPTQNYAPPRPPSLNPCHHARPRQKHQEVRSTDHSRAGPQPKAGTGCTTTRSHGIHQTDPLSRHRLAEKVTAAISNRDACGPPRLLHTHPITPHTIPPRQSSLPNLYRARSARK